MAAESIRALTADDLRDLRNLVLRANVTVAEARRASELLDKLDALIEDVEDVFDATAFRPGPGRSTLTTDEEADRGGV